MCPYADGPEAPGIADCNVVVKITGTQHVQKMLQEMLLDSSP
jgi:hypothetical protein